MSDDLIPLSEYLPSEQFIEQTFPAAFAVINAALYHAVTIGMAVHGVMPHPESTPGATRYNLRFPTGDAVFLYVLQRSENITTIRMHPIVQRGERPAFHPQTFQYIGALLANCVTEATDAIRYEHPDFTLRPVEGLTPPMPLYSDEGWPNVFRWQALYARSMPDKELAALQQVQVQTLSNKRSEHGATRRRPMNTGEGGKSERNVSKKK